MNDTPERRPDDEKLARWLRDLPPAEADPAFRDTLREGFADGSLASEKSGPPRRIFLRVAVAAAAAIVMVAGVNMLNRGPALSVASIQGAGAVLINGNAVETSDRAVLESQLTPGAHLMLPADVTLDLETRDVATFEIVGGTHMTLPDSPGRWFGRATACSVLVGEVRLATGSRFPGTEQRFYTPDGMVVVTGTLLSVQCDELGTCVCVLEGTAQVGVHEADLEAVRPGYRKIMMKDGTREIIPVKPMHRDGVLDFSKSIGHHVSP